MPSIDISKMEAEIYKVLKQVIDPELLVNIVDLGLVYGVAINETNKSIGITMTLTTSGCPLGGVIMEEVRAMVEAAFSNYNVHIHLVWEPKWTPDLISPEGRKMLGNK
jgi:metal-sulfur cluster biosynthetic enzyme